MKKYIMLPFLLFPLFLSNCSSCQKEKEEAIVPVVEKPIEPPKEELKFCKDGQGLDYKSMQEFRELVKGKWLYIADKFMAYETDTLRTRYIEPSKFYLVLEVNDSDTIQILGKQGLLKKRPFKVLVSPAGKLSLRVESIGRTANSSPKTEFSYFYLCTIDRLILDDSYKDLFFAENSITIYSVYKKI